MICGNCGNTKAYQTVSGKGWEFCDRCARLDVVRTTDVYWKPGMEEHGLPDNPQTGKPHVFGSRREKADFLKSHGLKEAGDRVRGSFPSVLDQAPVPDNSRAMAEKALADVSKMGRDHRRQAYLKILQETRKRSSY